MSRGVNAGAPVCTGSALGNCVGVGWVFRGISGPRADQRRHDIPRDFERQERWSLERRLLERCTLKPLLLGRVVISAGVIMHRAGVVAVGCAVSSGKIFHAVSE